MPHLFKDEFATRDPLDEPQAFAQALISWYKENAESYFFRNDRDPYKVWICEVGLQQTRIQAALDPLKRFLSDFPSVAALANAREEEVLSAFRGLGYYNRARNLHKGAQKLAADYGGQLPHSYAELIKIPSIGPYTAAAIASICFGEAVAVLDGNVKRVLSRVMEIHNTIEAKEFAQKAEPALQRLIQGANGKPGAFNEAVMELGQKICLKDNPRCVECPVSQYCRAYANGTMLLLPKKAAKQEKKQVTWQSFLIVAEGAVLLEYWSNFYFLKGQWSLPAKLYFSTSSETPLISFNAAEANFAAWLEGVCAQAERTGKRQNAGITNHKITIEHYAVKTKKRKVPAGYCWAPLEELEQWLIATATRKAAQPLLQGKASSKREKQFYF